MREPGHSSFFITIKKNQGHFKTSKKRLRCRLQHSLGIKWRPQTPPKQLLLATGARSHAAEGGGRRAKQPSQAERRVPKRSRASRGAKSRYWACGLERRVRVEAGRPRAHPRPPSPPGVTPGGKPAAPAGTTASPVPNPYTRPGLGLERARAGVPGRASREWGHGHGGASVLLGRFLLCPDDTLRRAAGEEGDRRPPVAPGEREEPASLFPGRRGRRPGKAEPDCADSGLPLQETLVWR